MPTLSALSPPTKEPAFPAPRTGDGPRLARRVLGLAWPVLALNLLILTVDLSDRYLVGNLPAPTPEVAQARQSARGTAHYVAWFISSYTVLVSVGAEPWSRIALEQATGEPLAGPRDRRSSSPASSA